MSKNNKINIDKLFDDCPKHDCPIRDAYQQGIKDSESLYMISHDIVGPLATLQGLLRKISRDSVRAMDELEEIPKMAKMIDESIIALKKGIKEHLEKNQEE